MKHLQRIAILVVAVSAAAQSGAGTTPTQATDEAFKKIFHEYSDALTKRDLAALDRIWAPDYTFINPQGELVTKAQRMSNLKSRATDFKAINPQPEKLQVQGDIVIDIGRLTLQGTKYGGQESSGEYRYMNVWMKKQGQWQMLANQITPIKK